MEVKQLGKYVRKIGESTGVTHVCCRDVQDQRAHSKIRHTIKQIHVQSQK